MRLFIAREMLDPHLKVSAAVLIRSCRWRNVCARRPGPAVLSGLVSEAMVPVRRRAERGMRGADPELLQHLRYAARTGRRLARALFHAMLRHGPKLEREQLLLGRFVDIGTELFALTAVCLRAQSLLDGTVNAPEHLRLAIILPRGAVADRKEIHGRRGQHRPGGLSACAGRAGGKKLRPLKKGLLPEDRHRSFAPQ